MSVRLPRPDEYQAAVQNPRNAFFDRDLKGSEVDTNPLGLPIVASGGFAITYKFRGATSNWAVRCFHKTTSGLEDLEERYAAITSLLRGKQSRYFVMTEYQSQGIRVGQTTAPITKMEWVNGEPLNVYIERNIYKRQPVSRMASNFVAMVNYLQQIGVSHGDLQHGNILVSSGNFKLVDYDGMFVPALAGRLSNELGHVNYQHPKRTANDFNAEIDNFSAIVIYIALTAILARPDLWKKYAAGGENLLFQQLDFIHPNDSELLYELDHTHGVGDLATAFRSVCRGSLSSVPRLIDFAEGRYHPASTRVSAVSRPAVVRRQYEVLAAKDRSEILSRIGQRVEVIGQVSTIHESRTRIGRPLAFINFGHHQNSFYVVLWSDAVTLFAQAGIPLRKYQGNWVSVTGVVGEYQGRPQIVVELPSQLEILASRQQAESRLRTSSVEIREKPLIKHEGRDARWLSVSSEHSYSKPVGHGAEQSPKRDLVLNDLYKNYPVFRTEEDPSEVAQDSRPPQNLAPSRNNPTSGQTANAVAPKSPVLSGSPVPKLPQDPTIPAPSKLDPTSEAKPKQRSLRQRFLDWLG